jgi:hypothetical protein
MRDVIGIHGRSDRPSPLIGPASRESVDCVPGVLGVRAGSRGAARATFLAREPGEALPPAAVPRPAARHGGVAEFFTHRRTI